MQQTSWLNSQSLMMWQGEEETGTPCKYSIPNGLFVLFCSCYYTVDEDRSLITINRYIRLWTLTSISHHWLFKLFLGSFTLLYETWHTGQPEWLLVHDRTIAYTTVQRSSDVTYSCTFFHASTLWTITAMDNETGYDRLWKLRHIFGMPNNTCSKYYVPSKHDWVWWWW